MHRQQKLTHLQNGVPDRPLLEVGGGEGVWIAQAECTHAWWMRCALCVLAPALVSSWKDEAGGRMKQGRRMSRLEEDEAMHALCKSLVLFGTFLVGVSSRSSLCCSSAGPGECGRPSRGNLFEGACQERASGKGDEKKTLKITWKDSNRNRTAGALRAIGCDVKSIEASAVHALSSRTIHLNNCQSEQKFKDFTRYRRSTNGSKQRQTVACFLQFGPNIQTVLARNICRPRTKNMCAAGFGSNLTGMPRSSLESSAEWFEWALNKPNAQWFEDDL
ncbi:hypothetical protein B0H14DRAFT_3178119 [Mycena olivaceomarginata]|nr:hypothetical protein B0H14DRAFT_3178119 [Mycena olivaceomarginata]